MIRFVICLNVLALYIIYAAGKLRPRALTPVDDILGYLMLAVVGATVLVACIAVLRWKDLDA